MIYWAVYDGNQLNVMAQKVGPSHEIMTCMNKPVVGVSVNWVSAKAFLILRWRIPLSVDQAIPMNFAKYNQVQVCTQLCPWSENVRCIVHGTNCLIILYNFSSPSKKKKLWHLRQLGFLPRNVAASGLLEQAALLFAMQSTDHQLSNAIQWSLIFFQLFPTVGEGPAWVMEKYSPACCTCAVLDVLLKAPRLHALCPSDSTKQWGVGLLVWYHWKRLLWDSLSILLAALDPQYWHDWYFLLLCFVYCRLLSIFENLRSVCSNFCKNAVACLFAVPNWNARPTYCGRALCVVNQWEYNPMYNQKCWVTYFSLKPLSASPKSTPGVIFDVSAFGLPTSGT